MAAAQTGGEQRRWGGGKNREVDSSAGAGAPAARADRRNKLASSPRVCCVYVRVVCVNRPRAHTVDTEAAAPPPACRRAPRRQGQASSTQNHRGKMCVSSSRPSHPALPLCAVPARQAAPPRRWRAGSPPPSTHKMRAPPQTSATPGEKGKKPASLMGHYLSEKGRGRERAAPSPRGRTYHFASVP